MATEDLATQGSRTSVAMVLNYLTRNKPGLAKEALNSKVFFLSVYMYRQTSNIRHTLLGNTIADNSDVVGASPAGAAPTTSSFST